MLNKLSQFFAGLFGVLLIGQGIRWLVDPSGAAPAIGLQLSDGISRSTQIGDFGAFFFVGGGFALLGLITRVPSYLYTSAALVGFAAIFRILAWAVHDAALTPQFILPEIVFCGVFLVAAARMRINSINTQKP